MKQPIERFMAKVQIGPAKNGAGNAGCWNWTGATNGKGYGQFSLNGKTILAHHFLLLDRLEKGKEACHHCDNPSCVRPSHIFIGTRSDNMQDCVKKGRHKSVGIQNANSFRKIWHKGETNHAHKLTEAQARQAKECPRKRGAATRMAKEFGVSLTVICDIRDGKRWTHLATMGKDTP